MEENKILAELKAKLTGSAEDDNKFLRAEAERFAAEKNLEGVDAATQLLIELMPEGQRAEIDRLIHIDGMRLDEMHDKIMALIKEKNMTEAKSFAERLYTTCLGRDSEEEGLKFWSQELANLRITGTEAAQGFFFSKEFEGLKLSDKEYVTRLYRTFMDREPEAEGFNFWISELKSGKSRQYIFDGFSNAQEFAEICAEAGIIR